MTKPILFTTTFEQKKTLETLIAESRADSNFYLFLGGSAIITALGLTINSPVIVIGGMLVAPLLFPILSLGMGVTTGSKDSIFRALYTIGKSVVLVLIISFITAFLFDGIDSKDVLTLASTAGIAHFFIAFVSGLMAAFAWAKQNINSSLPGIAVSVSLLPPLSAVGVGVAIASKSVIAGGMMLFIVNLIGIVAASMLIFSLFGFSTLQKVEEKIIEKENLELKK